MHRVCQIKTLSQLLFCKRIVNQHLKSIICLLIFLKEQLKIPLQNVSKGFCFLHTMFFIHYVLYFVLQECVFYFHLLHSVIFLSSFLITKQFNNIKMKMHEILSTNFFLTLKSVSWGIISIKFSSSGGMPSERFTQQVEVFQPWKTPCS